MSILIDEHNRVIVQGITGREGQARTRLMLGYGTKVVGGVTPGKGGTEVLGVPVFNSCADAVGALGGIDISVLFVPANAIKEAALDAINAGVKLVVLVADRVPLWDAMEVAAAAKAKGARFVGPNTLGIASPGKAVVGMIGGRAESGARVVQAAAAWRDGGWDHFAVGGDVFIDGVLPGAGGGADFFDRARRGGCGAGAAGARDRGDV